MSSEPLKFKQATREAASLKIGVQGPSGAGKTLGALAIAAGLAHGERFAVIDTENRSASLYADRFGFDVLEIAAPYLTEKYAAAVTAAMDAKYAVVVIDSLSHQWDGNGGILQRKEETDARGGNHFSNWAPFTKEHNKFRSLILESPIHIVATMRSKMAYAQEGEGRNTKIKKLGLQPIQREGMEYEFTVAFDVQMDHKATASKDRTSLFVEGLHDLASPKIAEKLLGWLGGATPALVDFSKVPEALTRPEEPMPWDPKGKPLASEVQKESVRAAVAKVGVKGVDWPDFYQQATGHEYDGKMYDVDVAPLLKAVIDKRAGAPAKVAEAGLKDDGDAGLQSPPSPTHSGAKG